MPSAEGESGEQKEGDQSERVKDNPETVEDKPEGNQLEVVRPDVKDKAEITESTGAGTSKKSEHRWEIWRRYSEFEVLRNFLQAVYPHVSACVCSIKIFWVMTVISLASPAPSLK